MVLLDGPVDALQDLARERVVAVAEDLHHVDVRPGRHAEHLHVTGASVRGEVRVDQLVEVVGRLSLGDDRADVAEGLAAARTGRSCPRP